MRSLTDDKIDELIKPPRRIFEGFDYSRSDKLKPTGAAERDRVLSERLQPPTPLREVE